MLRYRSGFLPEPTAKLRIIYEIMKKSSKKFAIYVKQISAMRLYALFFPKSDHQIIGVLREGCTRACGSRDNTKTTRTTSIQSASKENSDIVLPNFKYLPQSTDYLHHFLFKWCRFFDLWCR